MSPSLHFVIIFDKQVERQILVIDRRDRSLILDATEQQLSFDADVRTRNRKPMRIPNSLGATWELRCGINNRYRVFYDIDPEEQTFIVLAIGRKIGNRLFIGNEEFIL